MAEFASITVCKSIGITPSKLIIRNNTREINLLEEYLNINNNFDINLEHRNVPTQKINKNQESNKKYYDQDSELIAVKNIIIST